MIRGGIHRRERFVKCGKPGCWCSTDRDGHGPYWYIEWRDLDGRKHTGYIGLEWNEAKARRIAGLAR